ncbi:hypothetical protein QCE62_19665 [Caballeronia sp. LZ033]|nr:hypothetical protein [Caballeronia sp. LZ033]
MKFETIEQRFDNWGHTVRMPKFQSGVCAQWARLYVALRDACEAPANVTPVERDGWLVERAWSALPNHAHKWVLKYTYVWRMSPDQVQARMRRVHKIVLRGRPFDLILAESERSLSQSISRVRIEDHTKSSRKQACKLELLVI